MKGIFIRLLSILTNSNSLYDELVEIITLKPNKADTDFLQINNISFIPIQGSSIQIETKNLNFKFYWNDEEFLKKYFLVGNHRNQNIFIYNSDVKASRFYLYDVNHEFFKSNLSDSFFFANAFTYIDFINELKLKSVNTDDNFQFIDNYDESSKNFLITSSKEPGKLILTLPNQIVQTDISIDKTNILSAFNFVFQPTNKNLPVFLKNEIYTQLKSIAEPIRIKYLFENFLLINKNAEKNFETFLNDLSIDDLKKSYDEYKKKYFELISDVIGKITNQFLALPITVATAAYAIIKLEDSVFALVLILTALIGVSVYLSYLLKIYKNDLDYFKIAVDKDYNRLIRNAFFTRYQEEKQDFEIIKSNLDLKIKSFQVLVYVYFGLMWLFNALLCFLLIYVQLKITISILLFLAISGAVILLMLYVFLLKL